MRPRRSLTTEEIDDLLDVDKICVSPIFPDKFRSQVLGTILTPMRVSLSRAQIADDPLVMEELKKEIESAVAGSVVQAGEAVGILCAQSIGERQTQLTLNSFHSAGLAIQTVVSGVPRFLELLNATKDPRISSNIFHLKNNIQTPEQIRTTISHNLVHMTMADLVTDMCVFSEKEEEVWFGAFESIYSNEFRDFQHGVTLSLDVEKLYRYRIPMYLLKKKIEESYADLIVVFGPVHVGQLDIFIDVSDIHLPTGEDTPSFITADNFIHVFLNDVVCTKILDIVVCGVPGISQYHMRQTDDKKWVIETAGSNFRQIMGLRFIDSNTATSTNMWDIYESFGIEAVREFLIHEFVNVVSSDGTFINRSHILLLCDIMTHQGHINSISRYGMKKEQTGVLSRSSFEESLDQFCKAGYAAEKEPITAVSAAIMCGKRSRVGTGLCSLKMDWKTIMECGEIST
jgi:DNA-directed RNA polymerase beta' subunit